MGAPADNLFKADTVGQQQHAGVINGISVSTFSQALCSNACTCTSPSLHTFLLHVKGRCYPHLEYALTLTILLILCFAV